MNTPILIRMYYFYNYIVKTFGPICTQIELLKRVFLNKSNESSIFSGKSLILNIK